MKRLFAILFGCQFDRFLSYYERIIPKTSSGESCDRKYTGELVVDHHDEPLVVRAVQTCDMLFQKKQLNFQPAKKLAIVFPGAGAKMANRRTYLSHNPSFLWVRFSLFTNPILKYWPPVGGICHNDKGSPLQLDKSYNYNGNISFQTVLRHQTGAALSSVYDHLPIDAGTYQASVAGPGISHAARGLPRSTVLYFAPHRVRRIIQND